MLRRAFFSLAFLAATTGPLDAGSFWSIYWQSPLVGCNGWGTPITSPYYPPCDVGGIPVSICPAAFAGFTGPYGQNRPITLVGYQFTQMLSDPTAQGHAIIGSAHYSNGGDDGADVFASTSGVGDHTTVQMFGPGLGLPQGGPLQSHLDVYGDCDKGQQQFLVVLLYTPAPADTPP